MITRVRGTLTARGIDRIEVMTASGVAYQLHIPLGVLEGLPRVGEAVDLHTALVVKEDAWLLYGFATERDRALFNTVTSASGVGPALGLGLISALGSGRLVRAIRDRDLTTLQTAPRVGRKIAERLCVELADRMKDFADGEAAAPREALDGGAADAARALVSLGYAQPDAERAVRKAVERNAGGGTADLVRAALAELQRR
ncbi:MAG: Holliday junction branch migration protein RuvA [Gemmatimonadota bacterium]|nr:Holliday junction branch migration protein RuvA [Gemmatimonadota bacterium]